MYVSVEEAKKLKKLGFRRLGDEISPIEATDVYMYNNEEWAIGGRILPEGPLLAPKEVFEQGTLLYSVVDMAFWLQDNGFTFTMRCNGIAYKVVAVDSKGKEIKGTGGAIERAFSSVIEKILENRK